MELEGAIIKHLLSSQTFLQKAASSLKSEFFDDALCRRIFVEFTNFHRQNFKPSENDIIISLSRNCNKEEFSKIAEFLKDLKKETTTTNIEWLLKETEKWMKMQAFKNAVAKNIDLMDSKKVSEDERFSQGIQYMKDALRVGFTKTESLDFFDIVDNDKFDGIFEQYKFLETGFKPIDDIFMGGFSKNALYVIMASTGVGKTLAMIFLAFEMMKKGHNVIYFSHEISKNALLVRVLANVLSMKTVDIINLRNSNPDEFTRKLQEALGGVSRKGSLKIESFPNGQCTATTMKSYLDEMKIKYDWTPSVVFSDYLNIMASSKMSLSTASRHFYVQSIAEECRELAVEYEIPFITATQTNREGLRAKSATDLTHMSESMGAAITADGVIALSDLGYEEDMVKSICEEITHIYNCELLKTRFGGNTGQKVAWGVSKDFQRFVDIGQNLPDEEIAAYVQNQKNKNENNQKHKEHKEHKEYKTENRKQESRKKENVIDNDFIIDD